ncbi:tail fiber protein [Flavobacterium seoulense]|uniref:Peptidase S74 domain-containing protein n=1 Tax=Flavobacterium seoulense TaxID=1492738 RepID=A0A066WLG4_9FLAO|nr:tail fiber protein [Flavobacterium seoulense]KDN54711.1 hypothetical protein FEM21_22250 [Flavobacterium seoulense]
MKNKLIFILVITFSFSVSAQIYTPDGIVQGESVNNNVGIGTSSTDAKLTIQAGPNGYPTPLKAISIWGPNSPTNFNSAQDISWDFSAAGSAVIRSYRGGSWDTYLQFLTNNFPGNVPEVRLHINGDGNVGIGTTNPSNLQGWSRVLDVSGIHDSKILATSENSTYKVGIFSHNHNWYGGGGFVGTESNHSLHFITNYNPKMSILTNGNVGIGTINPTSKLTVAGNIASREVKVTVDAGADFVFEKDYDLPTLESVDKFITKNKHLPEIASAKEMQKDGINLSEMNIKLLQKIEELTLYVIELKKEISNQKEKITIIEKQIKSQVSK